MVALRFIARLAMAPKIRIPNIALESDVNGAPHSTPGSDADNSTGRYEHRHVQGGFRRNLPREDPRAFAQAIIDVADA